MKMSYSKLALGNLKHRKKQYILLIVGIILSMVFSSASVYLVAGASSSATEIRNQRYGIADNLIFNIESAPNAVKYFDEVYPKGGKLHIIGYGCNPEGDEEDGTSIAYLDENAKRLYEPIIEQGTYPVKPGEIAIEVGALNLLKKHDAKIGDTIKFTFWVQNGKNYLDETVVKEYTLVGILKDKRYNLESECFLSSDGTKHTPGVPAAFVSEKEKVELGGKEALTGVTLDKECIWGNDYMNTYNFLKYSSLSTDYLKSGYYSDILVRDVFFIGGHLFLAFVLAVVLLLVADLGIINSFSTNLKERKKQIGLLRGVGATRSQIRKIYLREAAVLCLICTPVSILISGIAVKIIVENISEHYVFKPVWWTFPLGISISVLCVVFSAVFPLFTASKITPMQAIRDLSFTYKMRKKKIKTQDNFDTSKLIANRNMTFFKATNVLTSIILTLAIASSLCGFSLLKDVLFTDGEFLNDTPDYYITQFSGINGIANYFTNYANENDRQDLYNNPYVDHIEGIKSTTAFIFTDKYSDFVRLNLYSSNYFNGNVPVSPDGTEEEEHTKETYKDMYEKSHTDEEKEVKKDLNIQSKLYPVKLFGFDDEYVELLKKHVAYGEINEDKLNSGEEIIIVAPRELELVNTLYTLSDYDYHSLEALEPDSENYEWAMKHGGEIYETAKNDFKVGDTIDFGWALCRYNNYYKLMYGTETDTFEDKKPDYDYIKSKAKIGAIIYELPPVDASSNSVLTDGIKIVTTADGIKNFTKDLNYESLAIRLNQPADENIDKQIMNIFDGIGSSRNEIYAYSKFQSEKEDEKTKQSLYIMILSVTILFFTICGSMVNNSITSRIRESKRKIGTLRAVGASTKEITVSYIRQLIVVLGSGTIGGILLSAAAYFIYALVCIVNGISVDPIKISFIETLIAIILLFISCAFNMYFKIKKEMKNSIVENIREL